MTEKSEAAEATVVDETPGTAVELGSLVKEIDFRQITSMADFVAAIGEESITLAHEELGDGFTEVRKEDLCGVRCIFVNWSFRTSTQFTRDGKPAEWVRVRLITSNGVKGWFSDGSEGIYKQLRQLTDRTGKREALYVHDGLSKSEYTYTDPATGDTSPATTFYVSEAGPA